MLAGRATSQRTPSSEFAYQANLDSFALEIGHVPERPLQEVRMSETISPRSGVFVEAPARAHRNRPIARGYGLLLGAAVSMGLWAGLAVAVMRVWP